MERSAAAALAALAFLAGACGFGGLRPEAGVSWAKDVAVTLGVRGGLCPEGACHDRVAVDAGEGQWVREGADGDVAGDVDADAARDLARFVDDAWPSLTAQAFQAQCPTAFDGQEVELRFTALPTGPDAHLADADVRSSSTCQHVWPDGFLEELEPRWVATGAPWPLG